MPSATNDLNQLIANTRNAMGYTEIGNFDGTPRHVLPKRAASVMQVNLRNAAALAPSANLLRTVRSGLPTANSPGKVLSLEQTFAGTSRVVEAGAHVIVIPAAEEAKIINGEPVFERRDIHFDLIEPLKFTRLREGDPNDPQLSAKTFFQQFVDLPLSAKPIYQQFVDLDTMPMRGVHVSLSRAEMRKFKEGELAASTMASIVLGLSRAIDEVMMTSVLFHKPGLFGLQTVATAGLRFSELRALIGTNGTGAAVAPNGGLVAMTNGTPDSGGIPAELTDVMAETVIADFSRAAIAIHEDIQVVADRTGTDGSMTLTATVGIQALIPRRDVFWVRG